MRDLRTHLYRMSGIDFTQIDGMGVKTRANYPIGGRTRPQPLSNSSALHCRT